MKEFVCEVKIIFSGNNRECNSKEEYIKQIKESYLEEYGLHLKDGEIINIEEINK
tara:strand:+ start:260 stop:424 length:165 start_codon:yes stop_codon:yes gene_type:complete